VAPRRLSFQVAVKTVNPLNQQTGNTRLAGIIRGKQRKEQRGLLALMTRAHVKRPAFPVRVVVTRVAPSSGLDEHDGLGGALKGCIDGIADGLGLVSDRDARVIWELRQRRGRSHEYAVEVEIMPEGGE
jgi:hypothetical protein